MCLADDEIPVVRNGSDLADACSKMDHVSATDPVAVGLAGVSTGICSGFFLAIDQILSEGTRPYCAPANITIGQGTKVILKYLNDHPKSFTFRPQD